MINANQLAVIAARFLEGQIAIAEAQIATKQGTYIELAAPSLAHARKQVDAILRVGLDLLSGERQEPQL